jgi:DNA-binding LytR/AlgR family response regulator
MAGTMDGVGLAQALRQRYPNLPVLLVTGYSASAAAAEAEFTVLRKPYQMSDLSRAMARAIADVDAPASDNVVRLRAARRKAAADKAPDDPPRQDPI